MRLFAHSTKDSFLVGLAVLEIALLVYSTAAFSQLSPLTTVGLGALHPEARRSGL
jgi:hypothetical protein